MAPPTDPLTIILAKLKELRRKSDEASIKSDETNQRIQEMQSSIHQLKEEQGFVRSGNRNLKGRSELQDSVFDLKTKGDLFIHELPKPNPPVDKEVKVEAPASPQLEATNASGAPRQIGHSD